MQHLDEKVNSKAGLTAGQLQLFYELVAHCRVHPVSVSHSVSLQATQEWLCQCLHSQTCQLQSVSIASAKKPSQNAAVKAHHDCQPYSVEDAS